MKQNVGRKERIVSLVSGASLLCTAFSGKKRTVKSTTGSYLLFRGFSGYCPLYHSLKIDKTKPVHPVHVSTSITINQPKNEVYAFWRNFENLPLFMDHLEDVTVLDEMLSSWKAKIPGGTVDWRSEITSDVENEHISWESLPGSQIKNKGKVQFKDAGKFGTEVHVDISYRAPAGRIGENIAELLNPLLEKMIKKDVRNLRNYLAKSATNA